MRRKLLEKGCNEESEVTIIRIKEADKVVIIAFVKVILSDEYGIVAIQTNIPLAVEDFPIRR